MMCVYHPAYDASPCPACAIAYRRWAQELNTSDVQKEWALIGTSVTSNADWIAWIKAGRHIA